MSLLERGRLSGLQPEPPHFQWVFVKPSPSGEGAFTRLMDELAGTENRLSVERKRYNDAVQVYNVAVRRFPANLMAGILGFREQPFFEVPAAARQAPQVKFP